MTRCIHLPCLIPGLPHTASYSWLGRMAPFLLGIFILVVSVTTTHQVIKQANDYIVRKWPAEWLNKIPANLHPATQLQGLPWVVDAVQIPAILGTPLAGLFILKPINYIVLIIVYTGVLAAGLSLFFYFIQKVEPIDYHEKGFERLGYRVSWVVAIGIAVNAMCAALALVVE